MIKENKFETLNLIYMVRVIHLSDFHLNPQNLRDWESYVKNAFVTKLMEINLDASNTFFVCTGDLIDKGGADYTSIEEAFRLFRLNVIDFICEKFSMPIDRFLLVPGNHDICRDKDKRPAELGNRSYFKEDYNNILSFTQSVLDKGERDGVERLIPYYNFETEVYHTVETYYHSFLGNAFKYGSGNQKIGISCLNSSWRAYGEDDQKYLILGEEQLKRCSNFIEDCEIKIALIHHPLDWFSQEKDIIQKHIYKDYDMLLVGHVHDSSTIIQTGFAGSLFTNIAPSCISDIRSESKAFSNGISIIDYDKLNKEIECTFYKYDHKQVRFIQNTELGNEGRFAQKIPDPNSAKTRDLIEKSIKNIKDKHYITMNEHAIAQKANVITSIKDAFIMPPITDNEASDCKDTIYINLNEITKNKQNQLFFGTQEIGKTTLLYRLVYEYVEEFIQFRKIPVYFDVNDIKNKEITTIIKEYLNCSTDEANKLITEKSLIFLIDNLDNTHLNFERIKKIEIFLKENDGVQVIATATNEIVGVPPQDYLSRNKIAFSNFYIRTLKAKHIKGLMTKWLPNEEPIKREARLDKMVTNFCSFSLPCTAMSVSLFLWSTENSEKRPINQAVLLDIYIEIILEKLEKENIYRDTFDYKNKTMLLAKIAEKMLESDLPNYSILYSDFLRIIEDYLRLGVGFDYKADVIANYLIERKLFIQANGGSIKFSHSCFFQFFIAKRMEFDSDFKEKILDENVYYKFPKEIDYYTGLTRNDKKVLEIIYKRFEEELAQTDIIFKQLDIDNYFTYVVKEDKPHETIVNKIDVAKIKSSRPSEEKMLDFYDNKLSKIPNELSISRKTDDFSWEKLIVIMCCVLRNSEGVEDLELKKKIYESIIRHSIAWIVIYREFLVKYVQDNNSLPPSIPNNTNLVALLKFLPFNVQYGINEFLGTFKLTPIILNKIKEDIKNKNCSDVEAYFSVAFYLDNQGKEYPKWINKLIRRLSNSIVREYCYVKLLDTYYRKTKPDTENESVFLDLLTELKIRSHKLPRRLTEQVKKSFSDGKNLFLAKNKFGNQIF